MAWLKNIFKRFRKASTQVEAFQYLGTLDFTFHWTNDSGKRTGQTDVAYFHFFESQYGNRRIDVEQTNNYGYVYRDPKRLNIWKNECHIWLNNGPTPAGIKAFDPSKIAIRLLRKPQEEKK